MQAGGQTPLAGDIALADLLRLHGRVMSAGVLDAVESAPEQTVSAAVSGYRFFELGDAATVIDDAQSRLAESLEVADQLESEADRRYSEAIPGDATIVEAFEARYARQPNLFASIGWVRAVDIGRCGRISHQPRMSPLLPRRGSWHGHEDEQVIGALGGRPAG